MLAGVELPPVDVPPGEVEVPVEVPVVVPVEVPVELEPVELVDWFDAVAIRSISVPPPRTTPTKFVGVRLVPNASCSVTVIVQSGWTL